MLFSLQYARYPNIFPYDNNRVVLQSPISGVNYINASHITGGKSGHITSRALIEEQPQTNVARFENLNIIASQGPLPNSCAHHLQMIFENKLEIVLMLTKLKEGNNTGKIYSYITHSFQWFA